MIHEYKRISHQNMIYSIDGVQCSCTKYYYLNYSLLLILTISVLLLFHSLVFSDTLLIIDSFIQNALLPYFTANAPLEPEWFKISNPYFWHPFKGIIVTVTIYLMVAISAERFRAVCYPLSKRQVRNK